MALNFPIAGAIAICLIVVVLPLTRLSNRIKQVGDERSQARAGRLFASLVIIILFAPMAVLVLLSFSAANFISFPPTEFSFRWYESMARDPELLRALWTSVWWVCVPPC